MMHVLRIPNRSNLAHVTLDGHKGTVRAVTFTADGERLATASADGTVIVWDAKTLGTIGTIKVA